MWIHISHRVTCSVVSLSLLGLRKHKRNIDILHLRDIIRSEDAHEVDILILDGVRIMLERHQVLVQNLHAKNECPTRISIEVSSLSGKRDVVQEKILGHKKQRIYGWRKNQFVEACKDVDFCKSIESKIGGDPNEDVEVRMLQKYFYAGHSARWMFAYTTDDVINEIHGKMQYVDNMQELRGWGGEKTQDAVNHLFVNMVDSKGQSQRIFTSEHVVKLITWRLGLEAVKHAYNIASWAGLAGKPVLEGWVVEMDFLAQVRLASKAKDAERRRVKVTNKEGTDQKWTVKHVAQFKDDDSLEDVVELKHLKEELENKSVKSHNHLWLIPEK